MSARKPKCDANKGHALCNVACLEEAEDSLIAAQWPPVLLSVIQGQGLLVFLMLCL